MNDLEIMLNAQYRPVLSLVVYHNEQAIDGMEEFYLESHVVDKDGRALEGKPLQQDTLAKVVEVFRDKTERSALITGEMPRNVLHFAPTRAGDYTLAWFRPAQQKHLYFQDFSFTGDGLAMVPAMLFVARAAHLYAFALENNRRPGLKTNVWPAPFPNVSRTGIVCLGSAKVKAPREKTFSNLIAYWEELWWNSKFTHGQNEIVKGGLIKLWKQQLRMKNRPFPMHRLEATKLTYKNVIDAISKNR